MFNSDSAIKKWAPVLDHKDAPKIKDNYRRAVVAALLENQDRDMKSQRAQLQSLNEDGLGNSTGSIQNFDPILISLVRRAMPNLIAYDIAGVQPMSAPTGLIFALKPKYNSTVAAQKIAGPNPAIPGTLGDDALYGGKEPFFAAAATASSSSTALTLGASAPYKVFVGQAVTGTNIAAGTTVTAFNGTTGVTLSANTTGAVSGTVTFIGNAPISSTYSGPVATSAGEALSGDYDDNSNTGGFKNMGFSIEKTIVSANTRALKADYTLELAQDLKAVHGLDAESELANILSSEILFEINREVINTINTVAYTGAQFGYTTAGTFDVALDADGRWAVERYKSLLVAIELECNQIAKDTRRGKGNFILCSSNVASTLAAAGVLDYAPALATNLEVDDTGNTFAGVLNGKIKVYVDPYSTQDYITAGYRGTNPYDAGIFYAPYVPLTMVRAVDPETFQPKIAFKTRYGLVANPFVQQINPAAASTQAGTAGTNFYYRNFLVRSLSLKGTTLIQSSNYSSSPNIISGL